MQRTGAEVVACGPARRLGRVPGDPGGGPLRVPVERVVVEKQSRVVFRRCVALYRNRVGAEGCDGARAALRSLRLPRFSQHLLFVLGAEPPPSRLHHATASVSRASIAIGIVDPSIAIDTEFGRSGASATLGGRASATGLLTASDLLRRLRTADIGQSAARLCANCQARRSLSAIGPSHPRRRRRPCTASRY